MNQTPSEATFWSWLIRGLGGAVTMTEAMVEFGPRINQAQHNELQDLSKRLTLATDAAIGRIHESGAEYHATPPRRDAGTAIDNAGANDTGTVATSGDGGSSHPGGY